MKTEKQSNRTIGTQYENKAAEYLIESGYGILAKNVNYRWGEIDIIAEGSGPRGIVLVFVEVRKRNDSNWIQAQESITPQKKGRLIRAIQSYLIHYRGKAQSVRVDLIAFQSETLQHFQNFMEW